MKFSDYVVEYLVESEANTQEKLIDEVIKYVNMYKTEIGDFIVNHIKQFARKPKDKNILQYHKDNTQLHTEIVNLLNKLGIEYKIESDGINIPSFIKFRKTGKQIEKYWGEDVKGGSMRPADRQEIGVLIWYYMLKNGLNDLNYPNLKEILMDNIFTKNQNFIGETLEWLKINEKDWNTQCKKSAETIIARIPQLRSGKYNLHQGGDLFTRIKKVGLKLSKLPGAEDKWNPSDIFFVRPNFNPDNYKSLTEYNAVFAEAKEVIGVSLKKGEDAGGSAHGAISLGNLFKYIGVKAPTPTKMSLKDGKLDLKQTKIIKNLLSGVKKAASNCPYLGGVLIYDNKNNFKLRTDNPSVDEVLGAMKSQSSNWGVSIPHSLSFLEVLKTPQNWEDFAYMCYCIATSQTDVSAFHYKVAGTSFYEMNKNKLNPNLFYCSCCRIPLDGSTNIIFDCSYAGENKKLQLRSKDNSAPQITVWNAREKISNYIEIERLRGL